MWECFVCVCVFVFVFVFFGRMCDNCKDFSMVPLNEIFSNYSGGGILME